jgi:bifunctional UDP-N-acetylglucosamine pyrophosphorylase / glucosamine-1-phosphate N-acetyltransferase
MKSRTLIVPAAGLGTRLGADRPKLLVPIAGTPMIDRVLSLFAGTVDRAAVIVHPSFERQVAQHLRVSPPPMPVTFGVQSQPTGMLDAIMIAEPFVRRGPADEVWIAWCDQVAIHPATIRRLAETMAASPETALALPTVARRDPYIHLERDGAGRIVEVRHKREGDRMPESGESDMGLFALSRSSFLDLLPRYARTVRVGAATGERNFLPFIAFASAHGGVTSFPAVEEMEAVGVNTPEELRFVEEYLAARASRAQ